MFQEKLNEKYRDALEKYSPPAGVIPGSWYDEMYYETPGMKSNWPSPFQWSIWGDTYKNIAHFILSGFPFSKSFLDVGCAKGFLLYGMLLYAKGCKLEIEVQGFDHSQYAIDNAIDDIKPFISRSSVDDFEFVRDYDVVTALDVLEHLTEEQSFRFLERARRYVNHNIFAVIPIGNEHGVTELSHINLHGRDYWIDLFTKAGWMQDEETKQQEKDASIFPLVRMLKWNVYIFKS